VPKLSYELKREIYTGNNSRVFLAWCSEQKKYVVIKRVHRVSTFISRECEMLLELSNVQNIVKVEDFFYTQIDEIQKIKIENFVFELVEEDLENIILSMQES
jgi:serine/threonine protein kinase